MAQTGVGRRLARGDDDIMQRGLGVLLVLSGALGVVSALLSISCYLSEGWFYLISLAGFACSLLYAGYVLAVGVMLLRKAPPRRGSLFWIAAAGICLIVPPALYMALMILGVVHDPFDGWWPPQEAIFHNAYWYEPGIPKILANREIFQFTSTLASILRSPLFWTFFPLMICVWSIWGRRSGLIDRLFGCLAVVLAIVMSMSAAETAWFHYQMTTYTYPPDVAVDFLYIPEAGWYPFYAVTVLLLVTTASLLFTRAKITRLTEQERIA